QGLSSCCRFSLYTGGELDRRDRLILQSSGNPKANRSLVVREAILRLQEDLREKIQPKSRPAPQSASFPARQRATWLSEIRSMSPRVGPRVLYPVRSPGLQKRLGPWNLAHRFHGRPLSALIPRRHTAAPKKMPEVELAIISEITTQYTSEGILNSGPRI